MILVLFSAAGPAAAQRAFTLDDMLKVEGFGEAAFDPSGRWLVFEQVRPYDQFGDYSFRTYAFGKSGHQLWRIDMEGESPATLLPGLDPGPHAFIEAFSPDGRYLAVMQYASGQLTLGAYDMDDDLFRPFGPVPALRRSGEHVPVWVSPHELAYAALPDGLQPAETSIRAYTGRKLAAAWENAWRGEAVTADEIRSGGDWSEQTLTGAALVIADARTGEVRRLADGLYADLSLSPDGTMLAALAVSPDLESGSLELFNLLTGERSSPAPRLDVSPYSLAWSPERCGLAAFAWPPGRNASEGRFYHIDACQRKSAPYRQDGIILVSERERGFAPRPERAVFVDGGLAVFARPLDPQAAGARMFQPLGGAPPGAGAPGWYRLTSGAPPEPLAPRLADQAAVPSPERRGTFLVTSADGVSRIGRAGVPEQLVAAPARIHASGRFSARRGVLRTGEGSDVLIEAGRDGARQVHVLTAGTSGAPMTLAFPEEGARLLAASSAARAAVFRIDDDTGSKLVLMRAGGSHAPELAAHINRHLAGLDFGRWVTSASLPDAGDKPGLTNCALLPPGARPGRPLPVIVSVYPGITPDCSEAASSFGFADPHSPYLWSGLGYAYVRLALPRDRLRGPGGPMDGLPGLVEAGLAGLVRDGIADPDRIALMGFSQGAAASLLAAAQSPRPRAVIAMNGFADFFSHGFGGSGVYSYTDGTAIGQEAVRYAAGAESEYGLGVRAFDDPMRYVRNSPVFLAPQIRSPVMLVHSDLDAFSMSQFDEMFGALRQAGKDVRYVRYWGEGHGPSSPANIRDLWERMGAFLREAGLYPAPEENP